MQHLSPVETGISASADAACANLAAQERAAAGGHPGRLLSAARRLREAQGALKHLAAQEAEAVERARALLDGALDKEQRSRAEADAAHDRGEAAVAKGLRRTARRAVETRRRAQGLLDAAQHRHLACQVLVDFLALRAEALEAEGQEALASRCSAMVGMAVRVDIQSIRAAGGAAWGPPAARAGGPVTSGVVAPSTRAEAVSTEARALAQSLLDGLLAPAAAEAPASLPPSPEELGAAAA